MWMRESNPESYDPQQSYAAKQLSRYDMQVAGVVVYVVTLTMLFVVALVLMLFWNEPVTQARAQAAKPAAPVVQSLPANQSAHAESPQFRVQPQR
jgi:peptidoglycan/LPS O-acetylase OafA/YrhL